ncbi:MAG: hypothetical protein J6L47_03300 [Alphaproteobacteria bacterium]|nr:hypothetical protein [Alphaproteobacteria bacterium]
MNKQNSFKLAILTLLLNGAVSCTPKQPTQNPDYNPSAPTYSELMKKLDSLSFDQSNSDKYYWQQSPEIIEAMRQDTTSSTLREKLRRAYETTQQNLR